MTKANNKKRLNYSKTDDYQKSISFPVDPPGDDKSYLNPFLSAYRVEMVSAYAWHNQAGWQLDKRSCPDNFLLLICDGEHELILEDSRHQLKPGSILLLPPDVTHKISNVNTGREPQHISYHCHIFHPSLGNMLQTLKEPVYDLPEADYWIRQFELGVSLFNRDPKQGNRFCGHLLKNLFLYLAEMDAFSHQAHEGDPRISKALNLIHENGQHYSRVEDLATACGLSPVYFRQLFKKQMQCSPKQYMNRFAMQQAANLLQQSDLPIKEIAWQCGFERLTHFHASFKKAYKCSPRQFRDRQGEIL